MINSSILDAVVSTNLDNNEIQYNEKLYLGLRYLYVITHGDHNWHINNIISLQRPVCVSLQNAFNGIVDRSLLIPAITSLFDSGYYCCTVNLPEHFYSEHCANKHSSSPSASSSARLFLDSWPILKIPHSIPQLFPILPLNILSISTLDVTLLLIASRPGILP